MVMTMLCAKPPPLRILKTIHPHHHNQDQYDTIDLSDNEIKRVENFPRMKRLKTLLLNNNFITRINPEIVDQIPQIESLILTNNKINSLTEIDSLSKLAKLTVLSFLDNPIVKTKHYRLYAIHKLPNLKVLDFMKVTHEVRECR